MPDDGRLVFLSHSGLLPVHAAFAEEAKSRLGLRSVAVTHGRADLERARRLPFDEVIDLVKGWEFRRAAARKPGNLEALRRFEERCGASVVWPAILQDRALGTRYSEAESLDYLVHALKILAPLIEATSTLAMLGELTLPAYHLAYHLRRPTQPYLIPMTARFFRRFYFDDTKYLEWPEVPKLQRSFLAHGVPADLAAVADSVIDGIREGAVRPVYFDAAMAHARTEGRWAMQFSHRRLRFLWEEMFGEGLGRSRRNPQLVPPIHWLPHRKLERYFSRRAQIAFYRQHALETPPYGRRFALLLPNHQPEYTIDTQGWPFADQPGFIRLVATSLPADMLLLVKDHRLMVGARPPGFYEEILRVPNVRLLDHRLPSQALIASSSLLVTVTGTAALEALCLDRPVIMCGRVFLADLEGVHVVRDMYELPATIRAHASSPCESRPLARAALAAMHACSYPGHPFYLGYKQDLDIVSAADQQELGAALAQELARRGVVPGVSHSRKSLVLP